jgi:hypothetical protein
MKTNNPVLDNLVESQTQFMSNWMDSAKKMQAAFTNGTIASEGQALYKEFFDKQVNILNDMKQTSSQVFSNNENPQEFFKKWFNQQANFAKQMADFTQSIQSSISNFGKPAQDYMSNFSQSNTAFTNIYNGWMNALNASYDTMSKNMNGGLNKDVFANFMDGSKVYAKMQEFFQPMASAMQKGQFNFDAFKNNFTTDNYNNLTRQMFGSFYQEAPLKEMYDNGMKQLQDFFTSQNNLGKEYYAQIRNMGTSFQEMMGSSVPADMKEYYSKAHDVFNKTFEPLMKLVNGGKEKESAEELIALMDRISNYTIRQAELQGLLQSTARKAVEKVAKQFADKFSDPKSITETPSAQDLYNEWVKVNETMFTELFASEEFSKAKGEALNLANDVKKHFEKHFENTFREFPIVFKSEADEMQKTIHDLKKQVKELQSKLAMQGPTFEEQEKQPKKVKK